MTLQQAPHQSGRVKISVCFVAPGKQVIRPVRLPLGTTIERAIHASGILGLCPEIDLTRNKVGIYGKILPRSHKLQDGDRVEIYTPALASGKNTRQLNAQKES